MRERGRRRVAARARAASGGGPFALPPPAPEQRVLVRQDARAGHRRAAPSPLGHKSGGDRDTTPGGDRTHDLRLPGLRRGSPPQDRAARATELSRRESNPGPIGDSDRY